MKQPKQNVEKRGFFIRFLNVVEKLGNKLPDPFMIFVYLAVAVMIASFIFSMFNASVVHPGTGETLAIQNLLSWAGLQYIITSMLENFTGFAPLGTVLAIMLGIGLAEKVGLLEIAIRKTILKAPPALVTYAIAFVGIMGNIASDAAQILIPPLAAMVFYKIGRHPLAGLAVGFASAGAGFTANLLIVGTDALLSGISTEAAAILDPSVIVTPADNWYFNMISVFVLTIVAALITEKIIEPKLGKYEGDMVIDVDAEEHPKANKGLRNAGLAALAYLAVLALLIFLPGSSLRNEEGGLIPSPFLTGIVPIIFGLFIVLGVAYGKTVGAIKSSRDAVGFMSESIKDMSGFIVLIFAASQFIAYFTWTNIGTWVAVNGAELLTQINFTGIYLIVGYILFTAMLNFLISSGSAKWALEAPVFIPLFMQLGYHPGFTQMAYRIGDSSTNIVTPLNPYFIVVLSFMREYDKKAGMGTLISLMIPYTLSFLAVWIIMFLIFFFAELQFGPGITPYL
ncbi:AbgT family transporter [Planococcus liqunii]|uniref:AbgT family transporter n=1 Tax=Planococcus TaxID=1372 RepID=UPI00088659B0|nr:MULTISPECIES: AbgT family transporter [Planococcus]WKA50522.1 AbgT family transporter [Planococcus sp. N056]SDG67525.1 aminobenzoyl-glutamate transport protein [Planococcus glaciei]